MKPDNPRDMPRPATDAERQFFEQLRSHVGALEDWYLSDEDGTPWLMVSYDFIGDGGGVRDTLRLDYDGESLAGGWSPACLNWDAETRAAEVPIDTGPPDGVLARPSSVEEAAAIASDWFRGHIARSSLRPRS